MRIIGSLVMRNEEDRYLYDCLTHMSPFFDDLFVWDDQSDDNSVEIAKGFTDHVYVRPREIPSFLEHEGNYRWGAWMKMEEELKPEEGDWILSFDADEFLVDTLSNNPRTAMEKAADFARTIRALGVILVIPEIFGIEQDGTPLRRTDGLWDTIRGPRFFAYRNGAAWSPKEMGCGSEPTYVAANRLSTTDFGLILLHYGYADPIEHQRKYERYSSLAMHGHNNAHVNSIIGPKQLRPWIGPRPTLTKEIPDAER